jgi:uncharacterized protein YeaC (DUF1315 family)
MSANSRSLAALGNKIFEDISRRDEEMAREREELSFDAVDELHRDVGFPCPLRCREADAVVKIACALTIMFLCQQPGGLGDGSFLSLSKIETLEMSLLHEKRTVAEIEERLQEAKAQKLVHQQLTRVRKHHGFLESMAGQLLQTAQRELEDKHKWENEWNHRLDTFKQQHFELQQGLQKKQQGEMQRLQQDFRRKMKKLEDDVALLKSKGRAPSPRILTRVQDENAVQVVQLFEKHAQERMHLTEKISKQEDLLMKSRSQSLQHLFTNAQTKSENLYRRFNPKQNLAPKPVHMIMEGTAHENLRTAAANGMPSGPPPIVVKAPPSRMSLHSSRASSRRLPSPRVEVSGEGGIMTYSAEYFLPGEGDEEEAFEDDHFSPRSTAPLSRMSRSVSFYDRQETGGVEGPRSQLTGAHSVFQKSRDNGSSSSTSHGGVVVTHNQSFGDQNVHQLQNTTENTIRRPLYAGAHGRIGKGEGSGDLRSPPPMPGTEQTGWKPIDFKKDEKERKKGRGTETDELRPAFFSQIVTTQYRSTSAKVSSGTQFNMGEDKRLQKASGAAYKVPIEKLGLNIFRTLPTVRALTKEEKEERRRKGAKSMLDHPQHPRSPDWGAVTVGGSSRYLPRHAGSVDQLAQSGRESQNGRSKLPEAPEQGRKSGEQSWPPLVHTKKEDPVVSEKFSQLEAWVEEKIRHILGQQGPDDVKPAQPGSVGGDRQLTSSQGRRMHSTSATPQAPGAADKAKTDLSLVGVGRTASGASQIDKGDSSIGKLLSRLKTTMVTDEALAEPQDKRKARPMPLMSQVEHMSGMRSENPTARSADFNKLRDLQEGQEVQQVYDDFELRGDDKSEPWNVSSDAQKRRDKFGQINSHGAHHAITPKTFKRVGFAADDHSTHDVFRPETGFSDQSNAHDRPETGSTWGDPASRPATGMDGSTRPSTWGPDEDNNEGGAAMDGEQMKKEFFPLVRHNKVEDVENALAAGFPVDTRDEHGNTALMVSCQNGHKRLAKLCLKYGASPDGTNHQGNTALHYAVGYGYQALAKYLISHGADDTIMNLQGQTPYEMTKR